MSTITLTRSLSIASLVASLEAIAPFASKSRYSGMLQAVHMCANGSTLVATASTGEHWATITLPCELEAFTACVAAKELLAALKGRKGEVSISVPVPCCYERSKDGLTAIFHPGTMRLTFAGGGSVSLKTLDDEEFPAVPVAGSEVAYSNLWDLAALLPQVKRVLPAVSPDLFRQVLGGVAFTDGYLVATDTHRLHGVPSPEAVPNCVVPELVWLALARHKSLGLAEVAIDGNTDGKPKHIRLALSLPVGELSICATLLGGSYPSWQRVIPQETTRSLVVDRAELSAALKAILPIAKDNANRVRFTCSYGDVGGITLSATSDRYGTASEFVFCEGENFDGFEFALNGKYALDALASIGTEKVAITATEGSRAVLFTASVEFDKSREYCRGLSIINPETIRVDIPNCPFVVVMPMALA